MAGSKTRGTKGGRRAANARWFWEALDAYLAKKSLKQTQQREIIVECFLGIASHVSAEELHEAVRRDGHNTGLATIYRTLSLLVEAGLVEQRQFVDGRYVYEVRTPGGHHDHIICIDCGTVFEFENPQIEEIQEQVAASHQIRLTSHRLDLFGNCVKADCERRKPVTIKK